MKKRVLLLVVPCVLLAALTGFYLYPTSTYTPVFMERAELEKSVFYQAGARDLVNPGKLYYKSPYIYVNEKYKGVHVINNTTPTAPVSEGFIVAPGCIDMAIKGDILYLDNAVDLVAFNLSTKQVTERVKAIFPEPLSPDGYACYTKRPENFVLVGWKKVTKNN
ncbi:MAG: hypothetical protein LBP56_01350 [Odoribacteraceae bacterium]|jgi:hypothetical protein|nr:hypothetical protein [Odoribacteraceae bacterium]